MSLSFHNTFPLERDNLAKLLTLVEESPSITNIQIAEATGIGIGTNPRKGKVQPTVDYATYSGLLHVSSVERKRRLNLTPIGKLILHNDPWLRKPVTQWVLHYHLSKQDSEAEAWAFFVHEYLPYHAEFERGDLEASLMEKFGHKIKLKILSPGVLLNSYLEGGSLGAIRLVRERMKRKYTRTQPYIPNVYTVAYVLAEVWGAKHAERSMIDPDVLSEPGHLGSTMSLSPIEVRSWLKQMNAVGVITQMQEAPPYQVVRRWSDILELLQKSYDEED
jgi:hypothetical protein